MQPVIPQVVEANWQPGGAFQRYPEAQLLCIRLRFSDPNKSRSVFADLDRILCQKPLESPQKLTAPSSPQFAHSLLMTGYTQWNRACRRLLFRLFPEQDSGWFIHWDVIGMFSAFTSCIARLGRLCARVLGRKHPGLEATADSPEFADPTL